MKVRHKINGKMFTIGNMNKRETVLLVYIYGSTYEEPIRKFLEEFQVLIDCKDFFRKKTDRGLEII